MSSNNLTRTNEQLKRLRAEWREKQSRPRPTGKRNTHFRSACFEPNVISSLVKKVVKNTPALSSPSLLVLAEAWFAITGPEISGGTRIISCNKGTLIIGVISNPLLQELDAFYKTELLETLQQNTAIHVRHLRFIKIEEAEEK